MPPEGITVAAPVLAPLQAIFVCVPEAREILEMVKVAALEFVKQPGLSPFPHNDTGIRSWLL